MMNYLRDFWRKWWPSIITFVLAAVMTGVFIWMGWGDLQVYNPPPRSEIVRNYGLLVGVLLVAFFAVLRSQIAKQHADSASQQADSALRQAETSEGGLRNDQFQRGVEMLNSEKTAIRLAGIYALGRLVQDHPEDYLDQVIRLLAAFVRRPAHDEETAKLEDSGATNKLPFREDVWEAVRVISNPNSIRTIKHDWPNIARSDLRNMPFEKKNFSGMILNGANMQKTTFNHCNFTGASLVGADLTGAKLYDAQCRDADFLGTNFTNTDISNADFSEAENLSQEKLNQACYNKNFPPKLPPRMSMDHEAAMARWEKCMAEKAESIMP